MPGMPLSRLNGVGVKVPWLDSVSLLTSIELGKHPENVELSESEPIHAINATLRIVKLDLETWKKPPLLSIAAVISTRRKTNAVKIWVLSNRSLHIWE